MIPWHAWNSEAIQAWVARSGQHRPSVPEHRRCVNEGAPGCTVDGGDRGWCPECWATIDPTMAP